MQRTLRALALPVCILGTLASGLSDSSRLLAQVSASSGSSVFPPTSEEWQLLWREFSTSVREGSWREAIDRLDRYTELLLDGETNVVLSNGSGLSPGARSAMLRALDQLPDEWRQRIEESIDSALVERWQENGRAFDDPERVALRHRLLRGAPFSSLYGDLLREEIDFQALEGDWLSTRTTALRLIDWLGDDSTPRREESAPDEGTLARAWTQVLLADQGLGDREAFREHAVMAREIAESSTQDKVVALLEKLTRPDMIEPADPPTGTLRTANAAGRSANAFIDPRAYSEAAAADEYRLGSVIWRQAAREQGLRRFLDERRTARFGELTPENERKVRRADVPLPFYPTWCPPLSRATPSSSDAPETDATRPPRGALLVLQHEDRLSVHDAATGRVRWSHDVGTADRIHNAPRAPIASDAAVWTVHGSELICLDLDDGALLWTARFQYDTADKLLRVLRRSTDKSARLGDPSANAEDRFEGSPAVGEGELDFALERAKDQSVRLAAPCQLDDDIVVPVQVRWDGQALCFLVRLDRRGHERWKTFLGSSRSSDLLGLGALGSPACLVPASSPTRTDRLIWTSNVGFFTALDPIDGSIEWLHEYAPLSNRGLRESIRDERRWHVNPVLPIGGGRFLVAPQDSGELLCVDSRDGAIEWSSYRGEHSTLVGASDQLCYVAGSTLEAVQLRGEKQGQTLWTYDLFRDGLTPQGRAVLAGDRLYVPTSDRLLTLDAKNGERLRLDLWDFPGAGGNLLQFDRHLVVSHPGGFLLYNDLEAETRRVERLPAGSAESWLRRAHTSLRSSDVDAGLRALDAWAATRSATPQPNTQLDRLHLAVADILSLAAESASEEETRRLLSYRSRVETEPTRKLRALIDEALWLESRGHLVSAMRRFYDALARDPGGPLASEDDGTGGATQGGATYRVAGLLPVPASEFLRDRIAHLRRRVEHPLRSFAAVEEEARQALREARETGTLVGLRETLRLYPFTAAAASATRDVATYAVDHGNVELATSTLLEWLNDGDNPFWELLHEDPSGADLPAKRVAVGANSVVGKSADSAAFASRLRPHGREAISVALQAARLLYESGYRARARKLYEAILVASKQLGIDRIPDDARSVPDSRPGQTIASYVKQRLADPGLVEVQSDSVDGLYVPLRLVWRSPADLLATEKTFLELDGPLPDSLAGCYLTQSRRVVECVHAGTGLPRWTVHLSLVPDFVFDPSHLNFPFARQGDKEIRGRFVDDLLILNDHRNLFAIDHVRGHVAWHVPIGDQPEVRDGIRRGLRERIRGSVVGEDAVYVTTSRQRLRCYSLEGEELWSRELGFPPTVDAPILTPGGIHVLRRRPAAYLSYDREKGTPLLADSVPGRGPGDAGDGARRKGEVRLDSGRQASYRILDPVEVGGGRVLYPKARQLLLVDLEAGRIAWSYSSDERSGQPAIQDIFFDRELPDEVIVVLQRHNKWPALVGVSMRTGRETWRYEKFPAQPTDFSVFQDRVSSSAEEGSRKHLFVIHGRERWKLLALEVSGGRPRESSTVAPIWPHREVQLGTVITLGRRRELHIAENAVIFPDPDLSVSFYDRFKGSSISPPPNVLSRFLVDKGSYRSRIVEGRLIVLTDRGAAAFAGLESRFEEPFGSSASRRLVHLIRRHLQQPDRAEAVSHLALEYFRIGDLETAMQLIDRSLESEAILMGSSRDERDRLGLLLEGIKQEAMQRQPAVQLTAHRLLEPPVIDGALDDTWNYSWRSRLTRARHINRIPVPGLRRTWEGQEDLSGVFYCGWDDEYFYFALDVEDDVLRAYDRDAENWTGDCLLIGLDPEGNGGYHQGGEDQLMTLALTIPKRRKEAKDEDDEDADDPENPDGDEDDAEDGEDGDDEKSKPEGLYSVKKKDDNSGAVYECAIPWSNFSTRDDTHREPVPGLEFGLSLLLTDDDTGRGATKTLSLNPCHLIPREQKNMAIWRFLVPEYFPRIRLR